VYVFRTALLLVEEGIVFINLPPSHSHLFFTCGDPARQRHEATTWLTVNEDLVKLFGTTGQVDVAEIL